MAALLARLRAFFLPEHGVIHPAPYASVVLVAIALTTMVAMTGPLQRVEWAIYDAFMRWDSRHNEPAPGVAVVAIDELSFAEIQLPWPWPRALHAQLIDALAAERPASITFDVIFDAPGTSPEGDAAMAQAIARAGNVVLGSDLAPIQDRNYSVTVWSDPIPDFASAAAAVAAVPIPLDPDGAMRRAVFSFDGRPALAAAAVERAGVKPPPGADRALFRFNGDPRLGIPTASYYQALEPKGSLPQGFFTGKHVFVGRALRAPATDEADHFRTPVALMTPGVTIHATIADAILRDRFIAEPIDTRAGVVALCLLLAGIAAAVTYKLSPGLASVAAAVAAVAVFAVAAVAFFANVRLPVMAPILTLVGGYAGGAAYRFALTNRERRLIKRAFTNYVAPAIVEQMLRDPSKLKLGGEEYDITVMFSDLEGFTTLSEHLTPQQLTSRLTGYFRDMLNQVLAERATLDKLIGDAIMVYFGCPIPDPAHPVQACRAALAMQKRMIVLNDQWAAEGLPRLRTRIGINTGKVVAGNMGTETIFNYTVLGDTVNLASRLEGVNKEYRTLIIVGEDTRDRVSDRFEFRELDWIRVKGKQQPVAIYELVGETGQIADRTRALFVRYAAGLSAYRAAQWSDAEAQFAAALAIDPADGPSQTFLDRCREYRATGTPGTWDGVHTMSVK